MSRGESTLRTRLARRLASARATLEPNAGFELLHSDVVPTSLVARFAGEFQEAFVLIQTSRDRVVGLVGSNAGGSAEEALRGVLRSYLVEGIVALPLRHRPELDVGDACVAFLDLGARASRAKVCAFLALEALAERDVAPSPIATRTLPVELGVQAARLSLRIDELRSLEPGDLLVGEEGEAFGWRGVVDGACAEFVLVEEGDSLVVSGRIPRETMEEPRMHESTDELCAIDDARVEVAVECARVVTTLAELEALRVGSVLLARQSVSSDVTLRVGGQPVARGRLVEVDGRLGVEVLELANRATPTLRADDGQ